MIPFLSAEPAARSPEAGRTLSEQAAPAAQGMSFGAILEDVAVLPADVEEVPDGVPVMPVGEGEIAEGPRLPLRLSRDTPLPDVAAPQAHNRAEARPAADTAIPARQGAAPQVPETVILPTRAAEVIATLTEGGRPAPATPADPPRDRPNPAERQAATPQAVMARLTEVPGSPDDDQPLNLPRRPQEDVVQLTRDLPQRAVGQTPQTAGQPPALSVAQTAIGVGKAPRSGDTQGPLRDQPKDDDASPRTGPIDRQGDRQQVAAQPISPIAAALHQQRGLLHPKDTVETVLRTGEPFASGLGPMSDRVAPHQPAAQSPSGAPASPEVARHVANQLAVAISQGASRQTEIALNPEELGRVRMAISAAYNSVSLTLFADRPETVDLLRRHIDILAQEFRALGYADINFSFGDEGSDNPASEQPAADATGLADLPEDITQQLTDPLQRASGVDLRL